MFEKTKVGIMGTGNIAGTMATTIKGMRGVVCHAVGSRDLSRAENFASEYKIKNAYGSYEELCNDPKVNLIYVATPHSEHFENVKLALEHGKAVFCEKAFTLNEEQAKELFKIAEENDVFLAEAMWTRFIPLGTKLREILASNVIGEISLVTADLSFNIAWKDRIKNPSLGGGALLDLGVYGLTFASMVLGDDVTDIVSLATKNEDGMDMQDVITLKYRTGQMAAITCSALSWGSNKGMIFGTNGHVEVDMINNFESITVYDNAGSKIGFYKKEKQITGYEYEVSSIMNAISEGWKECPEMPHAQTLKILNMMDFIRKQNGVEFTQEKDARIKAQDAESNSEVQTETDAQVEEQSKEQVEIAEVQVQTADDAIVEVTNNEATSDSEVASEEVSKDNSVE
ncbi:MAG: Gfo/Idh/MocA family oxidoreductase [Butyrivibrio sp.]|nr:Gfo/Idh/MocA family oxidoreductase [Butyrivibrio sp.]